MAGHTAIKNAPPMAWFLRAIEQPDGEWRCSHGRTIFDQHDSLPDALEHLYTIGATMRPFEVIIHRLDGSVDRFRPVYDVEGR